MPDRWWRGWLIALLPPVILVIMAPSLYAQRTLGARPSDSGGPLLAEQAAYDVKHYDLALRVNPAEQSITGTLEARALIVHPTAWFVLDLDEPLLVSAVAAVDEQGKEQPLSFERRGGRLWVAFSLTRQPGETVRVRVSYGGKPRVAPKPPWVGGFVWAKTKDGQPWVSTACQNDGADVWWPCKDHPSDEPDTMRLRITVPEPLACAANGRLEGVKANGDGTRTYNWFVSTPINNYSVALNIAPYRTIEGKYQSVTGETVPVFFWVLPENYESGQRLFPQIAEMIRFFEERLGPYPFRADKIGVAHTSHLGMEHQTVTAYGNNFQNNEDGFDWLLFHELGHEWWANQVTAGDWRDFWLHEGFQSYMDALYHGAKGGEESYHRHIAGLRRQLRNRQPVAPRESRTSVQMYLAAPDYVASDGDIYNKGAAVLHTLRHLIGDRAFFAALRRMAYPDAALERVTDGRQCRFATTDDFRALAERESGVKLDWFFEVYLRQPQLPRLVTEPREGGVMLRWEAPGGLPFPMPIEVSVGGQTRRVEMPQGSVLLPVAAGEQLVVDARQWVLRGE